MENDNMKRKISISIPGIYLKNRRDVTLDSRYNEILYININTEHKNDNMTVINHWNAINQFKPFNLLGIVKFVTTYEKKS